MGRIFHRVGRCIRAGLARRTRTSWNPPPSPVRSMRCDATSAGRSTRIGVSCQLELQYRILWCGVDFYGWRRRGKSVSSINDRTAPVPVPVLWPKALGALDLQDVQRFDYTYAVALVKTSQAFRRSGKSRTPRRSHTHTHGVTRVHQLTVRSLCERRPMTGRPFHPTRRHCAPLNCAVPQILAAKQAISAGPSVSSPLDRFCYCTSFSDPPPPRCFEPADTRPPPSFCPQNVDRCPRPQPTDDVTRLHTSHPSGRITHPEGSKPDG